MKTKVNVIVTYDDYTTDTFDCKVRILPLHNPAYSDKFRGKYWSQIIKMIKGDKTKLVKLSTRFYDEDGIFAHSSEYLYLCRNFMKLWFQSDQRDAFEERLVKKFKLASNTMSYSEKYETGEGDGWFPVNELANSTMKVEVTFAQSEKKVTYEDMMSGFGSFLKSEKSPTDMKSTLMSFLKSKETKVVNMEGVEPEYEPDTQTPNPRLVH